MTGAEAVILLGLLGLLASRNTDVKEVCDRLPYKQNENLPHGLDGDGGYGLVIRNKDQNTYMPLQTYEGANCLLQSSY